MFSLRIIFGLRRSLLPDLSSADLQIVGLGFHMITASNKISSFNPYITEMGSSQPVKQALSALLLVCSARLDAAAPRMAF